MRQPEFYAAVYGIIKNERGEFLFQKRANTGFNDGILQFPSGHIEGNETYFEALKRELKEEIGIEILEEDVELKHIMKRNTNPRIYFDIFFEINNYSGKLENCEPEKCNELDFFSENNSDITDYNLVVLEKIKEGFSFSEVYDLK